MRRIKPETKKFLAGGLAVFLALIFILGLLTPFLFGAETSGSIELSAQVGIDGTYVVDSQTPVNIKASNNGTDFSGEVQISVNISYDEYNPLYAVYSYPLELANGASKSFSLDIAIPSIIKSISIKAMDKNGKRVGVKDVPVKVVNTNIGTIGLLSDTPASLNYIMNYSFYSDYYSRNIIASEILSNLDSSNFPQNIDEIKSYFVIIINDFDTSTLSEEQKKLLTSWVTDGGRLIIGTGQNYEKIESGFDNLTLFCVEKTGETELSYFRYKNEEILSKNLPVITCDYSEEAFSYASGTGTETVGGSNRDAAVFMNWGDGDVITTTFDLGTDPVSQTAEIDLMINGLISDEFYAYIDRNGEHNYNYNNNDLVYTATGELKKLNSALLPIAFTVLFLYVLAVSPILYVILKRFDKRDFTWLIIPGVALVTVLLIFALSLTSEYRKPAANAINVVKLSNGQGVSTINSTVGLFSPGKGDVKVAFDGDRSVKPLMNPSGNNTYSSFGYRPYMSYASGFYSPSMSSSSGIYSKPIIPEGKNVVKLSYGENIEITYFDKSSWSPEAVSISQDASLGDITADLRIEGNRLSGTLENKTGMDFDEIIVGFGVSYFRFSNVINGQTIDINEDIDINLDEAGYYDPYYIVDRVFPRNYYYGARISELDFKLNQFANLLRYTLQLDEFGYGYKGQGVTNRNTGSTFAVNIFAFNTENLLGDVIKIDNTRATVINHNIFYTKTELNLTDSKNFIIPFGMINVSEIECDSRYEDNAYDNSVYVYSGGEITFSFELPNVNIDSFQFNTSRDFGGNPFSTTTSSQIYNFKSGEWEKLKDIVYKIDDYILDNSIKVKYTVGADARVYKPSIKLIGGNK